MSEPPNTRPELASELLSIASSVRALVEWHGECGSDALPTESSAGELLAVFDRLPGRARPRPAPARPAAPAMTTATVTATTEAPKPAAPAPRSPPVARVEAALPDAPALSGDERRARLAVVAETVRACTKCALHATRTQTVFARGNPDAELCFIGEGPGADEDAQGAPFVGKAGQLLDKMVAGMGLRQDEIYVANIVKCRPPNNRVPDPNEMATCIPYLHEQMEAIRPRVIVALGSTAVKGLLGTTDGITKIRGTWRLYRGTIPVMPTFHPAYVLRQPTKEVRGMVWSDLQQVLKELGRVAPTRGS